MSIFVSIIAQNNSFDFNKTNDYNKLKNSFNFNKKNDYSKSIKDYNNPKNFEDIDATEICELLGLSKEQCELFTTIN